MLSSRIGRHAIRQLNPSTCSLLQRVQSVNCVSADSQTSNSTSLAIRTRPLSNSQMVNLRGFATKGVVSKPKAHTGRNTVRKAKAASATGAKTSAKRAPAKKAPAKKAKVKDRKTNKKSAKKTVSKAKARPKKAITPEQKQKARLRELKAKALAPPHSLPNNAWKVLDVEMIKNAKSLAIGAKEASVKYKNLLPEERERYNHLAHENKIKNEAAYKAWIQSYTPDQIRIANNARAQLGRLTKHVRQWSALKDERQIKRPVPPRFLFNTERWASGDLEGMKITEVSQLLNREWEALSAERKKIYTDAYEEAKANYFRERVKLYGEHVKSTRRPRATKDSAAAEAQLQQEANA